MVSVKERGKILEQLQAAEGEGSPASMSSWRPSTSRSTCRQRLVGGDFARRISTAQYQPDQTGRHSVTDVSWLGAARLRAPD